MEQARNADKQNELNHDERCREVNKTVRESERNVILAFKKETAQPTKNLKELMKTHDKQYSSSWFWTNKRVNLLQTKLESFPKEAEMKKKMYLDAIEVKKNIGLTSFQTFGTYT